MPLLDEAGAALFLTYAPPVRPFKHAVTISTIVRSRLEQSGIELSGAAGAHLIWPSG